MSADDPRTAPTPGISDDPALPQNPGEETPRPGEPIAHPTPASATSADPLDRPSAVPSVLTTVFTGLMALACGVGGAYLYMRFLARPVTATATAGAATTGAPAADRTPSPDATTAADSSADRPTPDNKTLADRLDSLSKRVDQLKTQTKTQSQAGEHAREPSPDLSSIQVRLADLATTTKEYAPLPGKVEKLDTRLADLGSSLTSLHNDVDALRARLTGNARAQAGAGRDEAVDTKPAPLADRPRDLDRPAGAAGEGDLAQGAGLFQRAHYREAADVFARLETARPDDARVWYYAALAHGFVTGEWTGGTVELVEKGIACERRGQPDRGTIDAAFKDLTTATGKDWLAAYRQRVDVAPKDDANASAGPAAGARR